MDIKILLYSIGITSWCYFLLICYRYFRGQWQWSCLVPRKYIYPKRIKKLIKEKVLDEYKSQDRFSIATLEHAIEDHIGDNNLHRVTLHNFSLRAKNYSFSEVSFKFYLLLKIVGEIIIPIEKNWIRKNIKAGQVLLASINDIFSKEYVRQAMKSDDRAIILAEIIFRLCDKNATTYDTEIYLRIRRNDIIEKYEDIIEKAVKNECIKIMLDCSFTVISWDEYRARSVFNRKEERAGDYDKHFLIYILLFTKWQ